MIDIQGWGKIIFYYIYTASYVIYRHWVEWVLFILGVINFHPTSSGAWIATTAFECSIYIHSLLFPVRLTSWTFSFSRVFSLIFHVDKLSLSQYFTNDRGVAPKCWLSLSTFSVWSVSKLNGNNRSFHMLISNVKVYDHLNIVLSTRMGGLFPNITNHA